MAASALLSCKQQTVPETIVEPIKVIFETDLGNDTDDAIAIDLLHKYADDGVIELLAMNVNKKGLLPAEYADVANTFYGRGDIPIGVLEGTSHAEDAEDYCSRTLDSADFARSVKDYTKLPAAQNLTRKILSEQPDGSVTIISVGFSTNLARLLDTPADEYSPLTGKELVAQKVKLLSVMAGRFDGSNAEFNIINDIPAAAKVFDEWPGEIVVSPWELGVQVEYHGVNMDDLEWCVHPVAVAYKTFLPMPYDRPMWDPTAVMYGVEGDKFFTAGPRGKVSVDPEGVTTFAESAEGRHRILSVTGEQAKAAMKYIQDRVAITPLNHFRDNPNYKEELVPAYENADILTFADGRKVRSKADWRKRREEILEIFQSEMYGRMPAPAPIYLDTLESGPTCNEFGIRTQVRMWFREDQTGPYIDWLCVTPAYAKGPTPVILTLNYDGNHTVLPDEEIVIGTDSYAMDPRQRANIKAGPEQRGIYSGSAERKTFPMGVFLARGYSFVTASYVDISPDPERFEGRDLQFEYAHSRGVFELWEPYDPSKTDITTALTAWAWALCRGLDMIETSPDMDASKVVVTGYSRLGKASLIAGAFDERFPVVVPVQTGGGGAPLARRYFGENVKTEMNSFAHWFCPAYGKYIDNEAAMPFDQHMFLSCVAPRALLIEGFESGWYDNKGEFESVSEANAVWKFLGVKGLPNNAVFPEFYSTSAIGENLGYVIRDNEHGYADVDWVWAMDFADKIIKKQLWNKE